MNNHLEAPGDLLAERLARLTRDHGMTNDTATQLGCIELWRAVVAGRPISPLAKHFEVARLYIEEYGDGTA